MQLASIQWACLRNCPTGLGSVSMTHSRNETVILLKARYSFILLSHLHHTTMSTNENPSLIGGHVQYVKGAVEASLFVRPNQMAWLTST